MRIRSILIGSIAAFVCCAGASGQTASSDIDAHIAKAKAAAGLDFRATFVNLCFPGGFPPGAGRGRGGRGAAGLLTPRPAPDRATWYASPYKVFDNLYWLGTRQHSSWALKTSAGLVIIDTNFAWATQPEIIDGLTKLGLNPKDIKYVIISHAHGDHDQGAALLQSRYGAHVVMGAADWETTLKRPATTAGGVPKRGPGDISVGPEGTKITLGDTTVNVIATPGHTPGTLSLLFPVKDHGRALTVAYSGGTAFNFPRTAQNFAIYEASQKKMAAAAAAAGATILMSNHTEFDRAWDRVRAAQVPRAAGEPHPYAASL